MLGEYWSVLARAFLIYIKKSNTSTKRESAEVNENAPT